MTTISIARTRVGRNGRPDLGERLETLAGVVVSSRGPLAVEAYRAMLTLAEPAADQLGIRGDLLVRGVIGEAADRAERRQPRRTVRSAPTPTVAA